MIRARKFEELQVVKAPDNALWPSARQKRPGIPAASCKKAKARCGFFSWRQGGIQVVSKRRPDFLSMASASAQVFRRLRRFCVASI
jgi:hypothetical protein